jgi:ABC-type glycerol-3-phosphate transport system permease component
MKKSRFRDFILHLVILCFAALTLMPFSFALNNSFRSNAELYRSFFGFPREMRQAIHTGWAMIRGADLQFVVEDWDREGEESVVSASVAFHQHVRNFTRGYRLAWDVLRDYMINTLIVVSVTASGVVLMGSVTAYILSRYRFPGSRFFYYMIISTMMFPAVLTLVPSFMLVRELGLLNTYWAMLFPYIAGGQVFAMFIFKGFFDGLPEELFESARIDGAGHVQLYLNIVVPLSKPIISVVLIMNVFATWNNFLWPFVVNTEGEYHVIASGLYVMATSHFAQNFSTLFAAYMVSSIPLLILFTYATKPFIQGVTSGAFKA